MSDSLVHVYIPNPSSLVSFSFDMVPGYTNVLTLNASSIQENGILSIEEEINGVDVVLSQVQVQSAQQSSLPISVVPSTTKVKIKFKYLGVPWHWYSICVKVPQMQSETYLVGVCDEVGDKYRFGFNNQEKVNEIAGIGNHNTAEFWEYDTRVARRWNIDPVDQISISNYATFRNNTILLPDIKGDTSPDWVNSPTQGTIYDSDVKDNDDAVEYHGPGAYRIEYGSHTEGGSKIKYTFRKP